MPLVSEKELLQHAEKNGYAVPSFFPFNLDFIKPMIEVAEEERSPIVLCQGPEFIKSFGEDVFTQALITAANHAKVPVSIGMDHPFVTDERAIPDAIRAIHLGWKSVMLDGSLLSYEENVEKTKELAKISKGAGVSCIGALGEVKRFFPQASNYTAAFNEEFVVPEELMTDPQKAVEFINETNVDALAISVGQYVRSLWDGELPPFNKTARIDFKRLKEIREKTNVPLVMHGATHVNEDDLSESVKYGVSMIKVASEQSLLWATEIRKFVNENPDNMFPEDIQRPALKAVKESMRHYIRLFNASNQV